MVDSAQGAERRRHARHTLLAQVHVRRGREDVVMELVNISLSGALFEMGRIERPRWLELSRELDIAITHPISYSLLLIKGKVRRIVEEQEGTGFAVEFEGLDEDTTRAISELVSIAAESNSPDTRRGPPPLPRA